MKFRRPASSLGGWTAAIGLATLSCLPSPAAALSPFNQPALFLRGDANGDGPVDVSDAVAILDHLFLAGAEPPCAKAADANDDGANDLSDPVYLLDHLFLAGPPLPEPASACGSDPTADGLPCREYAPCEFETLASSYGVITTVAGAGQLTSGTNNWQEAFEGGLATEANLSNPHFTMADAAGNLYLADKQSHSIRKVTPEGIISTAAGMNEAGDDGDEPGLGSNRHLNAPNGLWVRRTDGAVFILDTDNGKVRRLSPSGEMTTLFGVGAPIATGRGLWVRDDEKLVYYCAGTELMRWTPEAGPEVIYDGFVALGNLALDPKGRLAVTDRGANRVYLIGDDGTPTPIAGNGEPNGGGGGEPALESGLFGVRGIWFLESGGYFLATHQGSQVWYVDTRGILHLFLDGVHGAHDGDGVDFRAPGPKVSEVRSVTVDAQGNVIVTENDLGYVRMVARKTAAAR